jgi:hypothetical protein
MLFFSEYSLHSASSFAKALTVLMFENASSAILLDAAFASEISFYIFFENLP